MIEHLLKIINVPGLGKLECVDSFEENPLSVRPDGWDVRFGHIDREGKNVTIAFVTKKIDAHCFPLHPRKCTLSKATFSSRWQRLSSPGGSEFFLTVLRELGILCN